MPGIFNALFLQAGYNTALVTVGAGTLGASAGAIGTFMLLRKRSLVSDAISHATLPGLTLAFILMALATGDGRFMPGLLLGAAFSAALGLLAVEWMTRRTRLTEDAAIGTVLSVFFGCGVVLLTIIQNMDTGRQAGIGGFLLGATAGMLRSEAEVITLAAAVTGLVIFLLRRPMILVCFDAEYAATQGVNIRKIDTIMLLLMLCVTVIGLKVAGLVLIVALAILPPVTARFWTNRPGRMILISSGIGALSAYIGTVLSASGPNLPTGALIVLVCAFFFLLSLIFSPVRGLLAGQITSITLRKRVHERQGLLMLARKEKIRDSLTLLILKRAGWITAEETITSSGHSAAMAAIREETLWTLYRKLFPGEAANCDYHNLTPIDDILPPETVRALEKTSLTTSHVP